MLNKKYITFIISGFVLVLGIVLFIYSSNNSDIPDDSIDRIIIETQEEPQDSFQEPQGQIHKPLQNVQERTIKKPFGMYIIPKTSPIQPEKFTGYHTGTDFEIFDDELSKEVPVFAICDGKISEKKIVSGYGGVIIQECEIENSTVTVLYGHILYDTNISSQDFISAGIQIGVLADDKSEYSGSERKHLHIGIHRGKEIDYRGYVKNQVDLLEWFDIEKYI